METDGALPCSQQTASGTYPKPEESSSRPHNLSSNPRLGLPYGFFFQVFRLKFLYPFLISLMCAQVSILICLIWPFYQ